MKRFAVLVAVVVAMVMFTSQESQAQFHRGGSGFGVGFSTGGFNRGFGGFNSFNSFNRGGFGGVGFNSFNRGFSPSFRTSSFRPSYGRSSFGGFSGGGFSRGGCGY